MRSLLVIAICLLAPGAALAYDYESSESSEAKLEGFVLNIGTGYGLPFGSIYKGQDGVSLSDGISGQVPIMVGLGFRSDPIFALGIGFTYAPALTKNCDSGSSCSASDMVLEAEFRVHISSRSVFSQWISAGFGYEWLRLSYTSRSDSDIDVTVKGLQFGFQLGGDYRVGSPLTIGPFFGVRFGRFDSLDASGGGGSGSADITLENQAWHGWFLIGVRGEFTS
jgi:hypothetical protein